MANKKEYIIQYLRTLPLATLTAITEPFSKKDNKVTRKDGTVKRKAGGKIMQGYKAGGKV